MVLARPRLMASPADPAAHRGHVWWRPPSASRQARAPAHPGLSISQESLPNAGPAHRRQTDLRRARVNPFVTIVRRVVGAVLFLTSMTGSTFWAVMGALCIVAGLGLLGWPWRQSHAGV